MRNYRYFIGAVLLCLVGMATAGERSVAAPKLEAVKLAPLRADMARGKARVEKVKLSDEGKETSFDLVTANIDVKNGLEVTQSGWVSAQGTPGMWRKVFRVVIRNQGPKPTDGSAYLAVQVTAIPMKHFDKVSQAAQSGKPLSPEEMDKLREVLKQYGTVIPKGVKPAEELTFDVFSKNDVGGFGPVTFDYFSKEIITYLVTEPFTKQ